MTEKTIIIAGPTASGKSQLVIELTKYLGKDMDVTIINADSMQVYSELNVITARPSDVQLAHCKHRLYGFLSVKESFSVGLWRDKALDEIDKARLNKSIPILVGGTGLYFKSLLEGLAPIPKVSDDIRKLGRDRALEEGGILSLLDEIETADPASKNIYYQTDPQRIIRAWEVLKDTGEPLRLWQKRSPGRTLDGKIAKILINPQRKWLYPKINSRVVKMVDEGALKEAKAINSMNLHNFSPALRAMGVREFIAIALGELSLDEGINIIQQSTRRYAKRQKTWFRNQASDWTWFKGEDDQQYMESFYDKIFPFIRNFLLTRSD